MPQLRQVNLLLVLIKKMLNKKSFIEKISLVTAIIGIMIAVHVINIILGGMLTKYGIVPRTLGGLFGILTGEWIHTDIGHLVGNISCFAILAWLCMLHSTKYFIHASVFIIIVGGLLLWLIGRPASHVGASGWIFGLWGLLLANAYFHRSIKNILICLVIIGLYSSLVFGLLPSAKVSFEGHITGMAAGILFARLTARNRSLKANALRDKE